MTLRRFGARLPDQIMAVKPDAAIAANVKELGRGG